ncbi:MAG: hypothetical protein AMS19_00745 [Gemmatimonas sp. SG8_23]|jgi:hypothetical protein|nr:MAG: hypothetical protein AMS19_00745 [Gemmatimonas sp. SG8_23]
MSDDVLERFHRALIEEIQTRRPEYLTSPFTVAEIYQNLVPYRTHRDRIGIEMNGDYEDALIRLLAGEGGYLILDSEPALRAIRSELETSNPNTAIYREYAAVDVRLNQAYLDLSVAALDELPDLVHELEAEDPVAMTALAPSERNADLGISPSGMDLFSDDAERPHPSPPSAALSEENMEYEPFGGEGTSDASRPPLSPEIVDQSGAGDKPPAAGSCAWCQEPLPQRDVVNYCPFCGMDQSLVPCAQCGAELEAGWRFCVSCGTEARS